MTARSATLLPDPEPRAVRQPVISVDDHLVEPPDLFLNRLPEKYRPWAPRVIMLRPEGSLSVGNSGPQMWLYEDNVYPNIGLGAVVGRPSQEWTLEPARFSDMRPGCFDVQERIRDMDLNGVWASLCFPSAITGFAGTVFSRSKDQELGLATLRAWNDWHIEEWVGHDKERFIPVQLPWLSDPALAADEVRANADRGFRAVTFPEAPHAMGLPSLHSGHWDPVLRACEETQTVVCLHTGSSGRLLGQADGAPIEVTTALFPGFALVCAADWLWSGVCTKFPGLQIALSEGGIGWVPMLLDRLDYMMHHSSKHVTDWTDPERSPSEVLQRNFWFCTIDDPSTIALRHRIGVDHIMLEVDYPHADSSWPDTQDVVAQWGEQLSEDELRMVCYENAARLFRHPPPPSKWSPRRTGGGTAEGEGGPT